MFVAHSAEIVLFHLRYGHSGENGTTINIHTHTRSNPIHKSALHSIHFQLYLHLFHSISPFLAYMISLCSFSTICFDDSKAIVFYVLCHPQYSDVLFICCCWYSGSKLRVGFIVISHWNAFIDALFHIALHIFICFFFVHDNMDTLFPRNFHSSLKYPLSHNPFPFRFLVFIIRIEFPACFGKSNCIVLDSICAIAGLKHWFFVCCLEIQRELRIC